MTHRQSVRDTAQQFARQTVKGEDAVINAAGNVIAATLAHKPVLAGTVVVSVYETDADSCEDPVPCLQVAFDSNGDPDTVLVECPTIAADIRVDTSATSGTKFDHSTGVVQVVLDQGAIPAAGFVARVDYEFDLENNPFQPALTLSCAIKGQYIELKEHRDKLAAELAEMRTRVIKARKDLNLILLDLSDPPIEPLKF